MTSSRRAPRDGRAITVVATILVLVVAGIAVATRLGRAPHDEAEAGVTQTVQAVGEQKYVTAWTSYGPQLTSAVCWPRAACEVVPRYWTVSRGTATVRLTTLEVSETIPAYDDYLLYVDVTTSSVTGTGDGGTGVFRIHSAGPAVDDSSAQLRHSSSGADVIYRGARMAGVRHLRVRRRVKVAAGRKPTFDVTVVLPQDRCTKGDGDGHCVRYANGSSSKAITIGSSG